LLRSLFHFTHHTVAGNGAPARGYFFNPNIHPYKEFERRLDTLKEYAASIELPLSVDGRYLLEDFLTEAMRSDRIRCEGCYEMRFREAARQAKQMGCEAFTTTLLVSPYQKHDLIRQVGERIGAEEGISFYYVDFRGGLARRGQGQPGTHDVSSALLRVHFQ